MPDFKKGFDVERIFGYPHETFHVIGGSITIYSLGDDSFVYEVHCSEDGRIVTGTFYLNKRRRAGNLDGYDSMEELRSQIETLDIDGVLQLFGIDLRGWDKPNGFFSDGDSDIEIKEL